MPMFRVEKRERPRMAIQVRAITADQRRQLPIEPSQTCV
jgi:hypothetical protein